MYARSSVRLSARETLSQTGYTKSSNTFSIKMEAAEVIAAIVAMIMTEIGTAIVIETAIETETEIMTGIETEIETGIETDIETGTVTMTKTVAETEMTEVTKDHQEERRTDINRTKCIEEASKSSQIN